MHYEAKRAAGPVSAQSAIGYGHYSGHRLCHLPASPAASECHLAWSRFDAYGLFPADLHGVFANLKGRTLYNPVCSPSCFSIFLYEDGTHHIVTEKLARATDWIAVTVYFCHRRLSFDHHPAGAGPCHFAHGPFFWKALQNWTESADISS